MSKNASNGGWQLFYPLFFMYFFEEACRELGFSLPPTSSHSIFNIERTTFFREYFFFQKGMMQEKFLHFLVPFCPFPFNF